VCVCVSSANYRSCDTVCRCVSLTKSLATIQKLKLSENNQSEYLWQWVGYNDPEATVNTKEITLVSIVTTAIIP